VEKKQGKFEENNINWLTFEALKASGEDIIHYQILSLNSTKLHNRSQAQTLD
jgi:hypothetical protein